MAPPPPQTYALGAFLGWNLARHLSGKSTACSWSRNTLPMPVLLPVVGAGAGVLLWHLYLGYT